MPNWCECDLEIRGERNKLKEFVEFAKTEDRVLDHHKFIPYPKRFADLDKKSKEYEKKTGKHMKDGFNSGGYEWCCKNWGTKWGICNAELRGVEDDRVEYGFESAWSPPIPVVLKMSVMFPELEFELRYFECGAAFNGLYQCKAGEVLTDEEGKYFGDRGG